MELDSASSPEFAIGEPLLGWLPHNFRISKRCFGNSRQLFSNLVNKSKDASTQQATDGMGIDRIGGGCCPPSLWFEMVQTEPGRKCRVHAGRGGMRREGVELQFFSGRDKG
jgi:hypothetical protein